MTALLRFQDVALSRGGRGLFDDLDLELKPGDALQVAGPNGSREIAFKIVQKFPGVTTDYLWFGRQDGMPLQRVRQLDMAVGTPAKSRTRS